MASVAPAALYSERLTQRKSTLAALELRKNRLSYWRLLAILLLIAAIWQAVRGTLPIWAIAPPVILFIALVWRQSQVEREAECTRRAIRFNEAGITRIEDRWHGAGETGERFTDPHHPYSADLDIFGHASLFQLLSTARTRAGEARLANWLTAPASIDILRERHAAVAELTPHIDLREEIAVLGDDIRSTVDPDHLAKWGASPAHPFPMSVRIFAFVLSLAATAVLLWWFGTGLLDVTARAALVAVAIAEVLFFLSLRRRIAAIVEAVGRPAHELELLAQLLRTLEVQQFQSPLLARLRGALDIEGKPASHRIAKLRRLMDTLDSRDNIIVKALDGALLWTFQTAMAIEAWRSENGRFIAGWLDAVSEIEALSALANYAWEHPGDPFPEFSEETSFEGDELGHPLLPEASCVRNSVHLNHPVQLYVVSGSNMSGKSTLLRSVGVNTVLALAGAPVRAKRLRVSWLALGASIRTMDSLEEGHSRFMAEIVRLKQILDLPCPALFLLDELLHGTNSHDRSIGAEGLVRALLKKGDIGLATTHDLSLSRVADDMAPKGINVHFEDRLEGGKLVFDYKMKSGVVTRSNALDLMRAVGLDV